MNSKVQHKRTDSVQILANACYNEKFACFLKESAVQEDMAEATKDDVLTSFFKDEVDVVVVSSSESEAEGSHDPNIKVISISPKFSCR